MNEAPSGLRINTVEEHEPFLSVDEKGSGDEEVALSTASDGDEYEEPVAEDHSSSWRKRVILGLAMIGLIVCSVVSSVFRKRMYDIRSIIKHLT